MRIGSGNATLTNLPVGRTFIFDKIPEPPDPCLGMEFERQQCAINGGTWDDSTCSCSRAEQRHQSARHVRAKFSPHPQQPRRCLVTHVHDSAAFHSWPLENVS